MKPTKIDIEAYVHIQKVINTFKTTNKEYYFYAFKSNIVILILYKHSVNVSLVFIQTLNVKHFS